MFSICVYEDTYACMINLKLSPGFMRRDAMSQNLQQND